mmetsp:Transcript_8999/g.26525  ORF Transcript_8999/g.26525 Transcript_8999/m.26525 type:complete len:207 (-) Transcript_8999:815-1435(-)
MVHRAIRPRREANIANTYSPECGRPRDLAFALLSHCRPLRPYSLRCRGTGRRCEQGPSQRMPPRALLPPRAPPSTAPSSPLAAEGREAASVLWRRHVVLRPPAADRVLRLEVGRDGERLLALDLLPLPHRVAHVPDRRRRLQHDDRLARHLRPVGDVDPNLDRRAARRADQQALLQAGLRAASGQPTRLLRESAPLLRGDAVGPLA